ncbi:MAG: iron ABC transporter permease [Clostridia bacterium]|nr:iron ABC transporter permease [Clostridia bacterium]
MKSSSIFSSKNKNRIRVMYLTGFLLVMIALFLAICSGSTKISTDELVNALKGITTSTFGRILIYVRLPRAISAVLCGAALAVSGAVIQGVLANRLASPSIIGVNSGAGLAITVCTALGLYGGWQLSLFSFVGAFATVLLVSIGAGRLRASKGTVILIGVAVNSMLTAISEAIITFLPSVGIMSNDFKIGEISSVAYSRLLPSGLLIVIGFVGLLSLTNELEILTLGSDEAGSLGINVNLMRTVLLLLAALLAGCAVSLAGLLSFIGLIIPHALRRLGVNDHADLIRLCAIYGAGFLCLCDTAARTLFSPFEIPVGIIMSFIGAPFFIFILIKGKGGHARDNT